MKSENYGFFFFFFIWNDNYGLVSWQLWLGEHVSRQVSFLFQIFWLKPFFYSFNIQFFWKEMLNIQSYSNRTCIFDFEALVFQRKALWVSLQALWVSLQAFKVRQSLSTFALSFIYVLWMLKFLISCYDNWFSIIFEL